MSEPPKLSGLAIRKIIIQQAMRAHVGHIGSALSVADLVASIFRVLRVTKSNSNDRDRFVLSKGHASLAMYAALFLQSRISSEQLNSYSGNNTLLGVHPEYFLDGIDFSTGSLGQGLSYAVGAALGAKMQSSSRRVFALISDAECNEGSIWEAIMFAAHHRLSNLVALIDLNGQQALGKTNEVLNLSPMAPRWEAFGWETHLVNGHDEEQLFKMLRQFSYESGPPHVIIAQTTFGKGVSFMENQLKWHYWPLSESEYKQAVQELESN